MDNGNSANIIDLNSYRVRRRERQADPSEFTRHTAASPVVVGGIALQLFWFWPIWFWVPVGPVTGPASQWDAS